MKSRGAAVASASSPQLRQTHEALLQKPPPPDAALVIGSWARELRELKMLAASNPDAALARVFRMPDKHERKAAATAVCLIVAAADPAKATEAAWNLDLGRFADEPNEDVVLEQLARRWAETDVMRALAWADALPTDEESRRDHVMKGVASAASRESPRLAAQIIASRMASGTTVQFAAVVDVLRHWAARDYAGALAWVSHFSPGPMQDRAIDELAGSDPVADVAAGTSR